MTRRTRGSLALCAVTALFAVLPAASMAAGPKIETIRLQDTCDLVSFTGEPDDHGRLRPRRRQHHRRGVPRADQPEGLRARAWWFNASGGRNGVTTLRVGDTLRGTNEGGEIHSFTEVPQFGGGCLPQFTLPLGPPAA